jgi:DNA polymerase III subunit gamma/tau
MLKTLEEPPPHVCFVLATTDPQKVPVTVLSRCMQFNLRNLAPQTIAERLTYVLQQEHIAFDDACLMRLGRAANGSMRDSLSLLDQAIAFGGGSVSDAIVMQMLGLVDSVFVQHILESLQAADGPRMVALADELQANGGAFEQVLLDLARELQQLAMAQQGLGEHSGERIEMAKAFGPQALQVYYQIAIHGVKDLPLAPDAHTGFTMTLLRLLAFVPSSASESTGTPRTAAGAAPASRPPLQSALGKPAGPTRSPMSAQPVAQSIAPVPLEASATSASATSSAGKARTFDGDWPNLAKQLRLIGFAQQFMQQSQLISCESGEPGYTFKVKVPIKILAEIANVNKVKDALTNYFGQPVKVVVDVGVVEAGTAAHAVASEKAEAQASAEAAIENDSFVQGLQKEFGATIVPGSIAPLPQILKP